MEKRDAKILEEIFSDGQAELLKKAALDVTDLTPNLKIFTFRIGNDRTVMLYGKDFNEHEHHTLMSEESFEKLKKFKLKGD